MNMNEKPDPEKEIDLSIRGEGYIPRPSRAGLLIENYENMDETGKEKLKEISKHLLDIWKEVNES